MPIFVSNSMSPSLKRELVAYQAHRTGWVTQHYGITPGIYRDATTPTVRLLAG
jgi:hypothetical protein